MKILNLIPSVDPRHGGPVEALRIAAEELGPAGHVVEALSHDHPGAEHVARFPVKTHANGPGMLRGRLVPEFARWLKAHGREYDVAVVHGLWTFAAYGGHGTMDPWFNKAFPVKNLAKQAFWMTIQGPVLRDAAFVLFTCEEERRLARLAFRHNGYRERVVAFGSADAPDRPAAQDAAFRAALPQLDGRRFLLFLSRIHPKKGCDLLIEAFASIASAAPDLDLVIAGPDQVGWQAKLQALAAERGLTGRVHFPGMLAGDAKWGAFRGAEAFVLPSHQENFGIVVAEAMACGTPVLISDKVNIWREIEASGGGLVEDDTVAGTMALLATFLALTPDARRAMGAKARLGYERHFGTVAAARDLIDTLNDAIAAGAR